MKRIIAILLSIALLVTALPIGMISKAEDSADVNTSKTLNADDTSIHRSADGVKAYTEENGLAGQYGNIVYDYNNRSVKACIYNLKNIMLNACADNGDRGIDRYPYVITKINVKVADYYNIGVEINMNASSEVDTMVFVVDGAVHVIKLQKGTSAKQTVGKELYLSAGEHYIMYMSAMPQNESDCPSTDATVKNWYPWTNFWSFTFENESGRDIDDSLEILDASTLTETDVENIIKESTRIEAEDTKYVTWNIYDEEQANTSASGGYVVGGPAYAECQQTFEELNGGLDKAKTPYLQYMVEAPAAGEYYLTIGANVGKSSANPSTTVPFVAVLVNDNEPVKAQFDGAWGAFDSVTVPVQLQEGLNVIRCTSVTPEQYSEGTAWVNLDYFEVQKGLTVRRTMVDAADEDCETYLYLNKYTDQDTKFGDPNNYADLRYDFPSLYEDMLGIYSDVKSERANYWPYIAFTVCAEKTGEYQISAKIGTRAEANSLGMIVDGAMHVIDVTTTSGELTKSVYLTEGEHVIIFTSPMPRDMESRPTTTGSNTQYPYMDFYSFKLSEGLCFGEKATDAGVQTAMTNYSRIEAEDALYASANGNYNADISKDYVRRYNTPYTVKVKGFEGAAIDGSVSDTEMQVNTTQTYADIEAGKLDKELTSYIQYVVKTETAGKYVLRVGAYVEGSGAMPYGTILVNGKAHKAQFTGNWNGYDAVNLPVELEVGINTIQCVGVTGDQESVNTAWIGYDYLDIPEGLTAGSIVVDAADDDCETYVYLNRYTDSGTNFGGPSYGDMRYDFPSLYEDMLGIYSKSDSSKATRWPYIAFTVRAEQAGEYQISANIVMDATTYAKDESAKTVGMIVDGAMYIVEVHGATSELSKTVYLTKGEHVVVFTSPIFRDMVSRPTTTGTSAQYPYMNFNSFALSAGLSFREKPTDTDIQTAMTNYSRIEAEDDLYVSTNGNYNADVSKDYVRRYNTPYTVKVKGFEGATIDGSVSDTEKNVNTTQEYADIEAGKLNKEQTSYIQYVVKAEETGTYVLRVGAYVEGSGTMPYGTILVNGEAYKAQFSGNWNGYDAVNLPVELEEGINTIQCVGITADQASAGTAWIGYDYLDIPEGLTATSRVVDAADSDWDHYLYLNRYQDKGTNFGGPDYNDMRYDYPSLYEEMLGIYSDVKPDRATYWPYIAFTVRAEQAGEYQISATINKSVAKTVGMIVDGAMYVIDATSNEVTKDVYLTEGEHVIIFTAQMPRDMESAPAQDDSLYPWMDYYSFKLSAGLSFIEKPTEADIQTAMTNYLRIEAEDKDYVSANGSYNTEISKTYTRRYHSPIVTIKGAEGAAIDGEVSDSEKNVNSTQTYEDIKAGNLDKDQTSYVQYKVTVAEAGSYVIRIGAYVEGSGTMPYGTILVNGEAYQAQFSGNWNGYDAVNLAVELQVGENIIQCIGVTADQTDTIGWIGYDYLEIPRGLNYHESGEYTNTSVESGLTFENRTTYETDGAISEEPYTISTWIYLPSGYTSRGGVIFGNYVDSKTPCVSFEISDNGVPRFYHINGDGEEVNLAFDKASIIADEWTNLTYTISGNTVSCYRNGVLVDTLTSSVDITLDAVTNQYLLGGDLRQATSTAATNAQYFKGKIIDVALYGEALSAEEVLNIYKTEEIEAVPYTRYDLENAEKDKDVPDTMGNNNLDGKPSYFTEKEEVTDYAYSFAVVGDTQIVTENDVNKTQDNLSKIYDWILANQEQKNIQYVFGLGDITDNNTTAEWAHAKSQISKLDGKIPYSVIRGNHDLIGYGTAEDKTADYMTQYLGTDAYKNQFTEEGGFYDANISNSWRTFTVGEVDYLMLALDYGPSDDVLNWAGDIIKNHPNHSVIITTHAYLYRDGTTLDGGDTCPPSTSGGYNDGDDMWTKLVSKYENIILVMCGHDPSDNIVMSRDVGINGNVVTSMLIDPQYVDSHDGSTGMLAMLYFSEDGTQVQVEYFSTVTGEYFKEENQFSFEFKIDDCDRIVKDYSAEEVAQFKAKNEYPNDVEGYLFAGWYTDEACDEASLLNGATPSGTTYALFVPKHVLSVKAQISSNLLDSNTTNDDTASIRFVTTVDTLLYKQVGFEISYTNASGKKQEVTSASGTVYQRLYAVDSTSKVSTLTPKKYFCGLSSYFKACTITEVPKDFYDTEFTVKPFWITMDGDKVYGDTVTKTIAMGIPKDEVWISSDTTTASDGIGYGTSEKPYLTLNYALSCVKDGGTIHVKDDLTYAADYEWNVHGKNVIITSDATDGDKATLDFSAMSDLCINDGVTFRNINLKFPTQGERQRVFAEGHKLVIEDTVGVENKVQLLGGSKSAQVMNTYLEVYAGNYSRIYGGSTKNVTGNTYIIVGGDVNSNADVTLHKDSYNLYGAGWSGTVSGNTYITVKEGAKFNYVYGGGESSNSVVKGSTNIEFAGNAMSIYGGSEEGTNADTHVVMTGGQVEQIFGGCEKTSMTGNTDVRVQGGTVLRRIYGGCYNEATETVEGLTSFSLAWTTENKVTGYTNVTIEDEANLKFDYTKTFSKDIVITEVEVTTKLDNTLNAFTRHENVLSGEKGVLIFNDDLYSANSQKIKFDCGNLNATSGAPTQFYNYLVMASKGGEVSSAGDSIYIKPDSGYVATVTRIYADSTTEVVFTMDEEGGYYELPTLESGTDAVELKVEFSQ